MGREAEKGLEREEERERGRKRRERESKGKEGSRQELDGTQQYMRGRLGR